MTHADLIARVRRFDPALRTGRVTRIASTYVEADGPDAAIGGLCLINGNTPAKVVGVQSDRLILAPLESLSSTRLGAVVTLVSTSSSLLVGDAFAGRAVDGLGQPIDDAGPIGAAYPLETNGRLPAPLERMTSTRPLTTGLRAIDGLLTLAKGQRVGIFAAPGVGKTTLMSQLARQVEADRCVICLVGERGREVETLWSSELNETTRQRTVLVAATSDQTAAMRVHAVEQALALAEAWRAEGHHVLFLLDSATRYAMALREIGLAAGEPPTVRAYTPGVFAVIPKVVERCGALKAGGAITAIMTVLSETDDVDDPISELMKSLLDGHIILARNIAEQGRYPAIDISRSISRLAHAVMTPDHRASADRALALISAYDASRTLIEAGVYVAGTNPETDAAIRHRPSLEAFLRQGSHERMSLQDTATSLRRAGEI